MGRLRPEESGLRRKEVRVGACGRIFQKDNEFSLGSADGEFPMN